MSAVLTLVFIYTDICRSSFNVDVCVTKDLNVVWNSVSEIITHSHVIRTTAKAHRKAYNLTLRHPKTPEPIDPKMCKGDYVPDIALSAKFCPDRTRVFLPIWVKYNSSGSAIISFFGFFLSFTAEAPTLTFTKNTSKDAVPRKDVPFGGFEIKI